MPYCMQCGHPAEQTIPEGDTRPRLVCPNCHYIHYENPKIVGGCILTHHEDGEDKVLLCRRAIEPRYGYWTLPAGFMEIGETMQQGAARECVEEAKAGAESLQLYCLFDIPQIGQVHAIYLGKLAKGNYGVGIESLECALFSESDIPWDELAFENGKQALQYYLSDRKTGNFSLHEKTLIRDNPLA